MSTGPAPNQMMITPSPPAMTMVEKLNTLTIQMTDFSLFPLIILWLAGTSDDIEPSNTFQTSTEFPESVNDVVLLDLAQRPLYGFDSILQWANDSQVRGFNFQFSTVPRYAPFIRSVKKRLHLDDLRYSMRTVNLPWGGSESFPVFDFIGMVHSLLDDPRVRPHLLIDWDCPSRCPPFEPGILDEIHSRSWDEDTHRLMIKENSNEVLAGVTASNRIESQS